MNTSERFCFEIEARQVCKAGMNVCGDVFVSRKISQEDRVVTVLADGLGSGIKAGVLATLTATFAGRCIAGHIEARKTAELIMSILPICQERKIAYSTFTIVDTGKDGTTLLVEYGNPPVIWTRADKLMVVPRQSVSLTRPDGTSDEMTFSRFTAREGDRLILFSDGVSQAGMGGDATPLGWKTENVADAVVKELVKKPGISARELAKYILQKALLLDGETARDDITCGVISFRFPRRLLVVTGPPIARERDPEVARFLNEFNGKRIVCGGTTGRLIARELGKKIMLNLDNADESIPPFSKMEGVDLVTEGTLTLAEVVRLLESPEKLAVANEHAARLVVEAMLDSDVICFLVGTRINEAHQDPNVPVELDIRRNIVRRIRSALETRFLKETTLRYV